MKSQIGRIPQLVHFSLSLTTVMFVMGIQTLPLPAEKIEGAEELGTMERIFRKGISKTGIKVQTDKGVKSDIFDMLQRGMTPKQVSSLLGRPAGVFVPTGSSGPPVFPIDWHDADPEWWRYPELQTEDGRHLQLLFANRLKKEKKKQKTLFSVWLWPSPSKPQQNDADQAPKDQAKPFSLVGQAIAEVVVDYITDSTAADERFSVALFSESLPIGNNARHTPLPEADQAHLKRRIPKRWKFYVPLTELRFPQENEKDPNDPDGETYRGIETKDGKRISVFTIYRIEYVDPQTLRIDWGYGSGPLTGHGGSLEISHVGQTWKIKSKGVYDR